MLKNSKKVGVVGHFGFGKELLNGQTIKTKILSKELERRFGENEVVKIDTHGGKKAIIGLLFKLFFTMRKCKNIVILPAHNGVRFFVPILVAFNRFFKRKIFYAVIGGWLPQYLQDKKNLAKKLTHFDGILVETQTLKAALEAKGFKNIVLMTNCKELKILKENELVYPQGEPYKLCTFSRVMKEKGIEDAIDAVKAINGKFGRIVYTLDIYGQVDSEQTEWFETLRTNFPEYIQYCGVIAYDQSVEVLKEYFLLLFPTRFFTEGVPGTLLDAYASGVPVIASDWESRSDILEEGECGYVYPFGDTQQFTCMLENIASYPNMVLDLKQKCIIKSKDYLPQTAIVPLLQLFDK